VLVDPPAGPGHHRDLVLRLRPVSPVSGALDNERGVETRGLPQGALITLGMRPGRTRALQRQRLRRRRWLVKPQRRVASPDGRRHRDLSSPHARCDSSHRMDRLEVSFACWAERWELHGRAFRVRVTCEIRVKAGIPFRADAQPFIYLCGTPDSSYMCQPLSWRQRFMITPFVRW
jgi:hypothetical protein